MNCKEFSTELAAIIDSPNPSPDVWNSLEQHARECRTEACRQMWADEVLLAAVLPRWRAAVPRVVLVDRVMSELQRTSPVSTAAHSGSDASRMAGSSIDATGRAHAVTFPDHRRARTCVAFTASVLSLMLLVMLLSTGAESPRAMTGRGRIGRQTPGPVVGNAAPTLESGAPAAAAEVIRTLAAVPQSATDFVAETMVFLSPAEGTEATDMDAVGPDKDGSMWSEQLEPWRRQLGTAFDAFLQSVADPPNSSRYEAPLPRDDAALA